MVSCEEAEVSHAIPHYYLSTYCFHLDHDACRDFCKTCKVLCVCTCHTEPAWTPAERQTYTRALRSIHDPSHYAQFGDHGWTVQHPLRCRPNMLECPIGAMMTQQVKRPPDDGPGRYRILEPKSDLVDHLHFEWAPYDPDA